MAEEFFRIRRGDTRPLLSSRLYQDDQGTPLTLDSSSGDAVRIRIRSLDGTVDLQGDAVVVGSPSNQVAFTFTAQDSSALALGEHFAEWRITFSDGSTLTVPLGQPLVAYADDGVGGIPAILAADLALIRTQIGDSVPPTDETLAVLLERLGSPAAVAAEVLQGRLASMVSKPLKWGLDGDMDVDASANVKPLSEAIQALRSSAGPGEVTVGRLCREGRER